MKAVDMMVLYGKNEAYVAHTWVMENAVEDFKAYWENQIHNVRNWKKEVIFRTFEANTCEVAGEDDKAMGTIFGFTKNGFRTINTK